MADTGASTRWSRLMAKLWAAMAHYDLGAMETPLAFQAAVMIESERVLRRETAHGLRALEAHLLQAARHRATGSEADS